MLHPSVTCFPMLGFVLVLTTMIIVDSILIDKNHSFFV